MLTNGVDHLCLRYSILTAFITMAALHQAVLVAQLLVVRKPQEVPGVLQKFYNLHSLQQMGSYAAARLRLKMVSSLLYHILLTGQIWLTCHFWETTKTVDSLFLNHPLSLTALFCYIIQLYYTPVKHLIEYLRLGMQMNYGLEEKKTSRFITRMLEVLISEFIVLALTFLCGVTLVGSGIHEQGNITGWIVIACVGAVSIFLICSVVLDMYVRFKYEVCPVPPGRLKDDLEMLSETVGFPKDRIFIAKASDGALQANALVVGGVFRKGKIILLDSLIQRHGTNSPGLNNEQIVGVLAHELGHWKCKHFFIIASFFELVWLTVLGFWWFLINYMRQPILFAFYFFSEEPPVIVLFTTWMLLRPLLIVILVCRTMLVRKLENSADDFAKSLQLAPQLASALVKLFIDSQVFPYSNTMYSTTCQDHPTLQQRLRRLGQI